jgi:hypothetical protein
MVSRKREDVLVLPQTRSRDDLDAEQRVLRLLRDRIELVDLQPARRGRHATPDAAHPDHALDQAEDQIVKVVRIGAGPVRSVLAAYLHSSVRQVRLDQVQAAGDHQRRLGAGRRRLAHLLDAFTVDHHAWACAAIGQLDAEAAVLTESTTSAAEGFDDGCGKPAARLDVVEHPVERRDGQRLAGVKRQVVVFRRRETGFQGRDPASGPERHHAKRRRGVVARRGPAALACDLPLSGSVELAQSRPEMHEERFEGVDVDAFACPCSVEIENDFCHRPANGTAS